MSALKDFKSKTIYENYLLACKKFAADSADWFAIDGCRFFTTDSYALDEYIESCDNAHGGLDVSWAFHLPQEKVERLALERFINCIHGEIDAIYDDEHILRGVWSKEETHDYLGRLVDLLNI